VSDPQSMLSGALAKEPPNGSVGCMPRMFPSVAVVVFRTITTGGASPRSSVRGRPLREPC